MAISGAFGDKQLDADLVAILGLRDEITPGAPVSRPRSAATQLNRLHVSRRASVMISVSLGLALLAGTAVLYQGDAPVGPPRPAEIRKEPTEVAALVAPPKAKAVSDSGRIRALPHNKANAKQIVAALALFPRLATRSTKVRATMSLPHQAPSAGTMDASASRAADTLVRAEAPRKDPAHLAMSPPHFEGAPSAALIPKVESATIRDDAALRDPWAAIHTSRVRRDSVAAIRALRRQ